MSEHEDISSMCHVTGRIFIAPMFVDAEVPYVTFDLIETLPDGREVWHEVYTIGHRIQMIRDLNLSGGRVKVIGIVQARARAFLSLILWHGLFLSLGDEVPHLVIDAPCEPMPMGRFTKPVHEPIPTCQTQFPERKRNGHVIYLLRVVRERWT